MNNKQKQFNIDRADEEEEFGCNYCWDRKKKINKEIFFLDAANNIRVCVFCPYCGREIE